MNRFEIFEYDVSRFPFRELAKDILGFEKIENIHEYVNFDPIRTFDLDQSTPIHEGLYSLYDVDEEFLRLYEQFISEYVYPRYECELVCQARPTFRVHAPGGFAVGEFHRDRDYNHSENEVNYLVPFTRCYGNNSIWIESYEGFDDFHPVELDVGQCLIFDGANLRHGNRENDTPITRISFDFRVAELDNFEVRPERVSVKTGMRMALGDYYRVHDGDRFVDT